MGGRLRCQMAVSEEKLSRKMMGDTGQYRKQPFEWRDSYSREQSSLPPVQRSQVPGSLQATPFFEYPLEDVVATLSPRDSVHFPQDGVHYDLVNQCRDFGGPKPLAIAASGPDTWESPEPLYDIEQDCWSIFRDVGTPSKQAEVPDAQNALQVLKEIGTKRREAPDQSESRSRSQIGGASSSNEFKCRRLDTSARLPDLSDRLKALVQQPGVPPTLSSITSLAPNHLSIPLSKQAFRQALPPPSFDMAVARRVEAAMRPKPQTLSTFVSEVPSHLGEDGLQRMLIALAEAVALDDTAAASELMKELGVAAHPLRGPMHRLTYYMIVALQARVKGTGAVQARKPSTFNDTEYARTMEEMAFRTPLVHFCIYGPLSLAADALLGHPKVHLMVNMVEGGLFMTALWTSFLTKLARQPNGPPHVRMTWVGKPEFSQRAMGVGGAIISRQAQLLGMPFQFQSFPGPLEDVYCTPSLVERHDDEALAIVFILRLQELADASLLRYNPREKVMQTIREWNPLIVVQTELEFDLNSIFFMARFRECVRFLAIMFDSFEAAYPKESRYRELYERNNLGADALDIVACEGLDRQMRAELLRVWIKRWNRARFRMTSLTLPQFQKLGRQVKSAQYPKGFDVETCCGGGVVLTWKGEAFIQISTWSIME